MKYTNELMIIMKNYHNYTYLVLKLFAEPQIPQKRSVLFVLSLRAEEGMQPLFARVLQSSGLR